MGAPKQKWTCEEEAALKAGVVKHGSGKWQTIIKDPEFSTVLYLRSNVDLKDKWRNMSVMSSGFGARDKSKVALKRVSAIPKQEETTTTKSTSVSDGNPSDDDIVDAKPLAVCSPVAFNAHMEEIATAPKRSIVRLENLILEAITNMKEPGGSIKTAIASYIEDQYWAPPDFGRVLSAKLKFLVSSGKLIKIKHNYRIAHFPLLSDKRRSHPMISEEGRQLSFPKVDRDRDLSMMLKAQIDLELTKMRNMTPQDAAAAAARAIAEAETAIAEAEEAAREADEADADAEAAKAFAEVASKMLRGRSIPKMMILA